MNFFEYVGVALLLVTAGSIAFDKVYVFVTGSNRRKLLWWGRSFIKEMRMGKFKAVFRYFWDTKYRGDINHLMDLLCWGKLKMEEAHIRLGDIEHSHGVNYTGWVSQLMWLYQNGGQQIPMKVFWDYERKTWMVIDGNHRLAAVKQLYPADMMIKVNLLRRPGHPELDGPLFGNTCCLPTLLKPSEVRV